MTDSGHLLAGRESQSLCGELFAALSKLIPDLRCSSTQGSCGLYQNGMSRFAYVYHTKTKPQIEVWCRGNRETLLAKDPGLGIRVREVDRPGWEESFPVRFRLEMASRVPLAAQYLASYCFPSAASKARRKKRPDNILMPNGNVP